MFKKIYTGIIKSDNVYRRHAAFGVLDHKRNELLMTSIAVMKK